MTDLFSSSVDLRSSNLWKNITLLFRHMRLNGEITVTKDTVDVPEQWGIPTYLVMSILWPTSWDVSLQPNAPHTFPLGVGSGLLGPRALHSHKAFIFFSSISVFSFLFSCCRWTITLWRWLWRREGGRDRLVFGILDLEKTDKGVKGKRAWMLSSFQSWVLMLHGNGGLCVCPGILC